MRNLCLAFLFTVFATLAAHAADTALPAPVVRFQLAADQKLHVTYQWPTACVGGLRFVSADPRTTELKAKGVALDGDAGFSALRLEVPLSIESGELHYPWAHPVGNGVYVYLPYYALQDNCGVPQYLLDAPGVMFLDGLEPGPVVARYSVESGSTAVLFKDAPTPGNQPWVYVDPAVGQSFARELESLFLQGLNFYQQVLPRSGYRPAGLVIGVTNDGSSMIGFGGDATNVIRLHYYNLPQPLVPAMRKKIKITLLHELAHRFHPESMDNTPLAPLPGEGGADFLRWSAAYALGLIDKAEAAVMFDTALAKCVKHTAAGPWMQLERRLRYTNRVPYDCGFVAYAMGLTARQGTGTALDRVDVLFASHAHAPNFDFAAALECAANPDCQARWLPRLFGNRETMLQVIDDWANQVGLLSHVPPELAANAPSDFPMCADPPQAPNATPCKPLPEVSVKLLHRVHIDLLLALLGSARQP